MRCGDRIELLAGMNGKKGREGLLGCVFEHGTSIYRLYDRHAAQGGGKVGL
jgi:hypothetical protein